MYETQYSYFINPATKKFLQTDEAHSPITTPPSFYFGDRPKFTLSFPADTIAEGDTLIAVLDNENRFLDTKQATGLNPVMTGVLHEVTSAEAGAQSLEIQLFNYSKKFADVINGHDNAVTCLFTVYLKSIDGEGNFTFVELGQTIANGEPTVTSPECVWDDLPVTKYYTREELDAIYNQFLAGVSLVVEYSNLAKSYAVGGTGTREGEDEDNAKYYAEMASQAANAVTTMYASIQTLATQIENTKEYIDGLVESIATDIRDISAIAASVTATAAQVSRDAQSVRQAKSSIDASVQFVSQAKSTIENLATQVSQNAVDVSNDKDTVAQLAVQVSNAASQVARDKADAKGYAESASTSLANVQTIQTDVTQKQTAITTMKNTIQGWYTQIQTWYNSINAYMEQMLGWWTDVDAWQQQVSADKAVVVSAKDTAVQAKNNAVAAKTAAETAQEKAEAAQDAAEDARDEAIATLANKRDILQTLVTSSSTALVAEAGKSYNWTVSAASTIALAAADKVAGKETRIDIYIDLQDGGSVTGDGVTISDAVLQSGWYKLIWDGTNATLYSTKAGGAEAVITIPAATTSYTLQDNKHYQQVPDAIPTYTLPTATMDGLVHEITVLVDFMHVTSCSFVDASGVPVTLQSAISPQIGEAYVFRCYWYGKWRVVPLKIRNAATASSATGVVEVSDAVAGDALALKMVAPRSVVVNQLLETRAPHTSPEQNGIVASSDANKVISLSGTSTGSYVSLFFASTTPTQSIVGHTYMLLIHVLTNPNNVRVAYSWANRTVLGDAIVTSTGWGYVKLTLTDATAGVSSNAITFPNNTVLDGIKLQCECIDLTQYFNGDSALIDSITSWDDLVAYDPRFASYVEYNTGTVEGVQPQVKVTGKNLLDVSQFSSTGDIEVSNGVIRTLGYVCTTGKSLQDVAYVRAGMIVTLSVDVKLLSGTAGGNIGQISLYNTSNQKIIDIAPYINNLQAGVTAHSTKTVTITNEMLDGKLRFYGNSTQDTSAKIVEFSNLQIELGSTATSYEPYHDGGTAQAPSPLFAVGSAADEYEAVSRVTTHKMRSVDLGTLNWVYSNGVFLRTLTDSKFFSGGGNVPFCCSRYTHVQYAGSIASMLDKSICFVGAYQVTGVNSIIIKDSAYTSITDFKSAVTGILFYYELATPTEETLESSTISLQAGSNVAMQTDGGRTLAELAMTYENLPAAD